MDVSHDPRDIAARFGRLVDDLRRLLAFHGLRSGAPQHLAAFARKLEDSKPFRTDLTAMLRLTRDQEQGRLTSDQMLSIVALAVGGEGLLTDPSSSPATTHTIALVLMLLAGIGGWSDTAERPAEPLPRAPRPAAAPRFAAKRPEPGSGAGEAPAMDVRAFVRSDGRSAESRPDGRADTRASGMAEPGPEPRVDARRSSRPEMPPSPLVPEPVPEPRTEVPHIVRREPLSEIVRPPAQQRPKAPESIEELRTPARPSASAPHPQRWPEPQARSDSWRPPEGVRGPERQQPPVAQTEPKPPQQSDHATTVEPQQRTEGTAATAEGNGVADATEAASANTVTGARIAAAAPKASAAAPPTSEAEELDRWLAPTQEQSRQGRGSRKLTLNAALAMAAVALLAFGVFEGLRSHHVAAPAPAVTSTGSPRAELGAATEPQSPASSGPAPSDPAPAASTASSVPTREQAPESAAGSPARAAAAPLTPPARTAVADDRRPSVPASSRHAAPALPAAGPVSKGLVPAPGLNDSSRLALHGPIAVPEATMNGQLVEARKPMYPSAALAQHLQGTVVLRAFVSADGTVRRTDVLSGPPPLVNSALAAATWRRYRPFLVHGRPVEVQTEITMHYVLPDSTP